MFCCELHDSLFSGCDGDFTVRLLEKMLVPVRKYGIAIALRSNGIKRKCVAFDLDSTLISCEFLDMVASAEGKGETIGRLTSDAMYGKTGFLGNYLQRLSVLEGIPVSRISETISKVPLVENAGKLISTMHSYGIRTAIITGAYSRLAKHVGGCLGIKNIFATELEERDGILTGKPIGPVIDENGKADAMERFCKSVGCEIGLSAAVGDGANDLKMLSISGLPILYCGNPELRCGTLPADCLIDLVFD